MATIAIHGLGGRGKTQTALEYAHRHGVQSDIAWLISAEQEATAATDLAELGAELGLPTWEDQNEVVKAVLRGLRERDRWLLVCDNVDNPRILTRLLPAGGGRPCPGYIPVAILEQNRNLVQAF